MAADPLKGAETVSDALLRRAKDMQRRAEEERRRLDTLSRRLSALEEVYRVASGAVADPGRARVIVRVGTADSAVPEHLTARALAAVMEVVSGEVAQVLTELEVSRG